jgi:SAM-dependent methyltransferase
MNARQSFDRVADVYDRTRAMPPEATAAVTAGIAAVLRDAAPDPRLLEVGIGTGRIAVPLAAAGIHVVGVDIAAAMLAQLRSKRADLAVVVADATAPPFRAAAFDGALFVHVLHLMPGAVVLRAARRLVRPGGVLLHGQTDYGRQRRRLFALLRDVAGEVGGTLGVGERWPEVGAVFAASVAEAGATCEERVLARWTQRTTGRRVLEDIGGRVYSNTWAIPDDMMTGLI